MILTLLMEYQAIFIKMTKWVKNNKVSSNVTTKIAFTPILN